LDLVALATAWFRVMTDGRLPSASAGCWLRQLGAEQETGTGLQLQRNKVAEL